MSIRMHDVVTVILNKKWEYDVEGYIYIVVANVDVDIEVDVHVSVDVDLDVHLNLDVGSAEWLRTQQQLQRR